MTQTFVAEILDVSKAQISYIENDKSGFSLEKAMQIAELFGVSLDWLLTGQEKKPLIQEPNEDFITIEEAELRELHDRLNSLKSTN